MRTLVPAARATLGRHRRALHEWLWFSVPGVAMALAVRGWLTVAMPWGYYHPDTHDFMNTVFFLEAHRHLSIHGKVTFLAPVLYTLAFLVPKVPALVVIPLGQHLRGVLLVFMAGALARLWFGFWRWLIVPLTVLAALDPAMIFWEHALMSESGLVFGAVALALGGTVFARWPGWPTLGVLLAGMFLAAAARPEGNLWQAAGVLVAGLVLWGRWRREWTKLAAVAALAVLMLLTTKTSHSGLLLYASLLHFTPDDPRTVPGFGPYIRPLRDRKLADRTERVADDVVRTSKQFINVLAVYARDHPHANLGLAADEKSRRHKADPDAGNPENDTELDLRVGNNLSNLCRRLAAEAARAHPWALPGYATRKFLARIDDDPGGTFEEYTFRTKQAFSLFGNGKIIKVIGHGLTGTPIDTPEQARAFVEAHYDLDRVGWFNALEHTWQAAVDRFHLPDTRYSDTYRLPGLPVYHLLAMLGMAAALFYPARLRRFQWAFVPTLAGTLFAVMLTAAVIPRHRFVYEPFWLLYAGVLADAALALGATLLKRRAAPAPAPAG